MPNHIKNFLTIKAEGERLAEILESIKDDEKGVGTIDFRKVTSDSISVLMRKYL